MLMQEYTLYNPVNFQDKSQMWAFKTITDASMNDLNLVKFPRFQERKRGKKKTVQVYEDEATHKYEHQFDIITLKPKYGEMIEETPVKPKEDKRSRSSFVEERDFNIITNRYHEDHEKKLSETKQ
jgi:hypothetical protein